MDNNEIPVMSCREAIVSENVLDFIIRYRDNANEVAAANNAICYNVMGEGYLVAYIYVANDEEVQRYNYLYSVFPRCLGLMDTTNIERIGVNRIRRQTNLQLYGQNIIIGFIDTGIDYTNSVFQKADGTTRILSIWDQTIQGGDPPADQLYGTEYTESDINEALSNEDPFSVVPTRDTNGHGTFMAGVAAGNIDNEHDFSGVAPQADIVVVKLKEAKQLLKRYYYINPDAVCYQDTDIIFGVRYLQNKANELNRPIVICLGLGTNSGGHEGNTILGEILNNEADRFNTCIVVPTGNEANYSLHYRDVITTGEEYQDVEIRVGEGEEGFSLELWAEPPNLYSVGFVSPSGEVISRIPSRINTSQEVRFVFDPTLIYVNYRTLELRTGAELIFLRFQAPTEGIWKVRVYGDQNFGNSFDMWLPIREFLSSDTQFIRPDPNITITDPANAQRPITVAGYNHTNNSIYINSGRGYTRTGRIKPDIAAPAVNIYGPLPGNQFSTRSGTSIATAHTAGVAALLMEWSIKSNINPYIDTSDLKALFIRGANRINANYPNREFGYGTLDVYGAINSLREID